MTRDPDEGTRYTYQLDEVDSEYDAAEDEDDGEYIHPVCQTCGERHDLGHCPRPHCAICGVVRGKPHDAPVHGTYVRQYLGL